jgi:tetratricopeptide (TPR) repeat protein
LAVLSGDAGFFQSWAMFEERQERRRVSPSAVQNSSESPKTRANNSSISASVSNYARVDFNTDMTKALGLYQKAVAVNKYHTASWVAWAKYEQRRGNLDDAQNLLMAGIHHFPESKNIAWLHCSLGNIAAESLDPNTAKACYERAIKVSATHKTLPIILEYAHKLSKILFLGFVNHATEETTATCVSPKSNKLIAGYFLRSPNKTGHQNIPSYDEICNLYERALRLFPREIHVYSAYIKFEHKLLRVAKGNEIGTFADEWNEKMSTSNIERLRGRRKATERSINNR